MTSPRDPKAGEVMSSIATSLYSLHPERLRSFVLPREHGAWGILLVPLLTGAWIGFATGRGIFPLILFLAASLALFCLRAPLEIRLGTSPLRAQSPAERGVVAYSILIYVTLAAFAVGWLLWREHAYGLLLVGGVAAIFFVAQAALKKLGRRTRMAAQLVGAIGLTSTAAGAYYVVTGLLDRTALILWAANWLFAANQIHFVQTRIHGARSATRSDKLNSGRWFLAGEIVTALLLAAAWRLEYLPGLAALAFVPVLIRGLRWFWRGSEPLAIHRLGFTELAHALSFGALFILGFQL
jgi:hypothetical protein